MQTPEDGSGGRVERGAELHAWADAYLPGAGWIGLDATSGFLTAEGHIGLAASPEPGGGGAVDGDGGAGGGDGWRRRSKLSEAVV